MGNIRHSFNTSNQETTFSQMPYRLLYSSYSKYEQDWESYPHTHYFSELFYVLNGCGSFIVEEESFPIRKQNLIIINQQNCQSHILSPFIFRRFLYAKKRRIYCHYTTYPAHKGSFLFK